VNEQTLQELKYANDRLLVFLDETGHETFAGDQSYYYLPALAALTIGDWRPDVARVGLAHSEPS
jgi:hypothetical protein